MRNNGTPKELKQAIMNGLMQATTTVRIAANVHTETEMKEAARVAQLRQLEIIENHVLDFFRQKFGVAYLDIAQWAEDRTYKDPAGIIRELAESTGVSKKSAA